MPLVSALHTCLFYRRTALGFVRRKRALRHLGLGALVGEDVSAVIGPRDSEALGEYPPRRLPHGRRVVQVEVGEGLLERVGGLDRICLLYTSPSPRD